MFISQLCRSTVPPSTACNASHQSTLPPQTRRNGVHAEFSEKYFAACLGALGVPWPPPEGGRNATLWRRATRKRVGKDMNKVVDALCGLGEALRLLGEG